MKEIIIKQNILKKLVDCAKHSIAFDDSRPILKYIQIKTFKNVIQARSCNGYSASRLTATLGEGLDLGENTFYIKAFPIKATKNSFCNAKIQISAKVVHIEVMCEYGAIRYSFDQPQSEYIDLDKVYANAEEHDITTYLSERFLIEASRSILMSDLGKNGLCIETKKNPTSPIIMKAGDREFLNEQLILPIRHFE